jgi:hypothetical protein
MNILALLPLLQIFIFSGFWLHFFGKKMSPPAPMPAPSFARLLRLSFL